MADDEVIRLLKIEHTCSQAKCDRNCSCCDIVQEQETLDVMYRKAIQLIEENAGLKQQITSLAKTIAELKTFCTELINANTELRNSLRKYEIVSDINYLPNGSEVYKENVGDNPYGIK